MTPAPTPAAWAPIRRRRFLTGAELARGSPNAFCRRGCEAARAEGIDFRGLLYPGVMLTKDGPKVLEFNARFGDPETQVYLTRLENDLLDLLEASVDGALAKCTLRWRPDAAVCVVMASAGYPGPCQRQDHRGLAEAAALPETKIFHAGTGARRRPVLTDGGRVLGVTALGAHAPAGARPGLSGGGKNSIRRRAVSARYWGQGSWTSQRLTPENDEDPQRDSLFLLAAALARPASADPAPPFSEVFRGVLHSNLDGLTAGT